MLCAQEVQLEKILTESCTDESSLRKDIVLCGYDSPRSCYQHDYTTIWIDRINAKCGPGIPETIANCVSAMRDPSPLRTCLTFQDESNGNFLLILEHRSAIPVASEDQHLRGCDVTQYDIESKRNLRGIRNIRSIVFMLTLAVISALLVFPFMSISPPHKTSVPATKQWPEDGYIHYPTPGSIGPKRQEQLTYVNALEWVKANPHDSGEWRVRMDDQALIPAELWDEDEDYYQSWYYDRYPHLRKIIQDRSFLRPSWLGSLDKVVEWDREFHFNHCVRIVIGPNTRFPHADVVR
jgi:hypothetical protein